MRPITILIVDDHSTVRAGLRALLSGSVEFCVVSEAHDGVEAVDAVLRDHPDVVLMDIAMPRMDGIEATRKILERVPETKVLIQTANRSYEITHAAKDAGALAIIDKWDLIAELANTVRTIAHGSPSSPAPT